MGEALRGNVNAAADRRLGGGATPGQPSKHDQTIAAGREEMRKGGIAEKLSSLRDRRAGGGGGGGGGVQLTDNGPQQQTGPQYGGPVNQRYYGQN
jgi:hypothetical protein